jgi:hypothetical protein
MKADRSWRRVQTESGLTYLDINEVVAVTKKENDYDIHMASGTIFTTPHLMPFMEDLMWCE